MYIIIGIRFGVMWLMRCWIQLYRYTFAIWLEVIYGHSDRMEIPDRANQAANMVTTSRICPESLNSKLGKKGESAAKHCFTPYRKSTIFLHQINHKVNGINQDYRCKFVWDRIRIRLRQDLRERCDASSTDSSTENVVFFRSLSVDFKRPMK